MELFDFDADLKKYTAKWIKKYAGKLTNDEIEEAADKLYNEWSETVVPELNTTPEKYFDGLKDNEILPLFERYVKKNAVPALLIETMAARPSLYKDYVTEIKKAVPGEYTVTLMMILEEFNGESIKDLDIYKVYLNWIIDNNINGEIKDSALDILVENADMRTFAYDTISDGLQEVIKKASEKDYERLSDLAVYCRKGEESYKLLIDLFLTGGEDTQLYAHYLGKYGDTRAIPHLKAVAATCNFATYREILNAVEVLGDELSLERNFEEDPIYKKVKAKMDSRA